MPARERKQDVPAGSEIEPAKKEIWNVPFQRNPYFTGRKQVFEKIHEALESGKIHVINGLGGMGKTQTAVEYAFRYKTGCNAVLWSKADSRDAIVSGFAEIAQVLNLPEKDGKDRNMIVGAVCRWLERNQQCLEEVSPVASKSILPKDIEEVSRRNNAPKPRIDYAKNNSENQIKLDENYIPILREESAALKYGGVVETSDLRKLVKRGEQYSIITYPIDFVPNTGKLLFTFGVYAGTNTIKIPFKAGTLKDTSTPISLVISDKLEVIAKALKGEVIFRLSQKKHAPFYLLKIEKSKVNPKGVMYAGMLLGGKEKEETVNKVSPEEPRVETAPPLTPNSPE